MTQETLPQNAYRIYKYCIQHRGHFVTAAEVEHALDLTNQNARYNLKLLADNNLVDYTEGSGWKVTKIAKIGPLKRYVFIGNKAVPKIWLPVTLLFLPVLIYMLFPKDVPTLFLLLSFIGLVGFLYESYLQTQQDMTPN